MISVIVPYYNSNLFKLRKCLDSILSQTYSDLEIIVIIDGLTINIDEVKVYYESLDKRVRFYSKEHAGVSAARNYGIRISNGDYISYIDSDDYIDNTFYSKLLNSIEDYDIAICGVTVQEFPTEDVRLNKELFFSLPSRFNKLQYTNFSVNKLYRREIINKYSITFPENVMLGEDALYLCSYFEHCNKISCISSKLYYYVPNDNSATRSFNPDFWSYEKRVIHDQYNLFTKRKLSAYQYDALMAWVFEKFCIIEDYYKSNTSSDAEKAANEIEERFRIDDIYQLLLAYKPTYSEFWPKDKLREYKKKYS